MNLAREHALVLERIELAAWRDVHAAATPTDHAALGLRARELAGALVLSCDRDESLLMNRVLGLGQQQPVTGELLDTLVSHYQGRAPGFAINLAPFAEPTGLEDALAARGFGTFFHHLKWWRDDAPLAAPAGGPELRRATARDARAWSTLAAELFEWSAPHAEWFARVIDRPGWWHGLAFDDTRPIATAAMYMHEGAAWFGLAGTLESHRRRGAQGALFAARVAAARAMGARVFTLETAPDWPEVPGESLRNARRAGFHPAYERPSWVWPVR